MVRNSFVSPLIVAVLLCWAGVSFGENHGVAAVGDTTLASTAALSDSAADTPVVLAATNFDGASWFGLGDQVVVTVRGLSRLLDNAPVRGAMPLLYINDVPMRGAALFTVDRKQERLQYSLGYDSLLAQSWRLLYRLGRSEQKVRISVGYDGYGVCTIAPEAPTVMLIVYRQIVAMITFIALFAAIIAFLYMARTTAIIRDGKVDSSYSLGKTQLAWWTFIIIGSYIFIGIVTGVFPKFSTNILVLLGISMATTAGAKALDEVPGKGPKNTRTSGKFLDDILSDGSGASIHRFQMFMWTLVFGVYFIGRSLSKLELPTIDDGQLLLMGISSATYLGLRAVEKNDGADGGKTATGDAPAAVTPDVPPVAAADGPK